MNEWKYSIELHKQELCSVLDFLPSLTGLFLVWSFFLISLKSAPSLPSPSDCSCSGPHYFLPESLQPTPTLCHSGGDLNSLLPSPLTLQLIQNFLKISYHLQDKLELLRCDWFISHYPTHTNIQITWFSSLLCLECTSPVCLASSYPSKLLSSKICHHLLAQIDLG